MHDQNCQSESTEWAQNLNPENRWRSVADAEVVHQAKNVIACDHRGLVTQTWEFHSDIQNKRNSLKEIMMVQVAAAWRAAQVIAQKISNDTVPTMHGTDVVPNSGLVLWPHVLTERQCSLCKFNSLYLHRRGQWANTVHWDLPQHESTNIFKLPELLLGFSGIKVPRLIFNTRYS